MTTEQRIKNLGVPSGKIDVVLDTDTYNEVDDQFALSYMMLSPEKLCPKAIYAAPFFNHHSSGPEDGMNRSYDEILKILALLDRHDMDKNVFHGSVSYLPDEKTPVISDAAKDLASRAMEYTTEKPLYVVSIGAITNVASALLINPEISEKIVVVWLGGHAHHYDKTDEFNMKQDIAAARVIVNSKAPFVQLPCRGVVSSFLTSGPELRYWLSGKGKLADYLCETMIGEAELYAKGKVWTRAIWDVTTIGWLLNDNDRFMASRLIPTQIPEYDFCYGQRPDAELMRYVYFINRDALMSDIFDKIVK